VEAATIPCIRGQFHEPQHRLELPGAHHPYLVTDAIGRYWVLKKLQPRGILAEAVGGLLGRALDVPIPEFACFESNDRGRGWLSKFVPDAQHWSAARANRLMDHGEIGRMLALDAIIHNEDRNTENIVLERLEDPPRLRSWAIDNEAALVARPRELASKGVAAPRAFALPTGFVATDEARRAARHAGARAMVLGPAWLEAVAWTATDVAGALDREGLAKALIARCRHAGRIVEDYLEQIP
jgi:hypothetical protein